VCDARKHLRQGLSTRGREVLRPWGSSEAAESLLSTEKMEVDLVTVGDPTIDTFLKIHDAHLALQVKPAQTQLCIDYADKIPVDEFHRMAGGNCINAAVAAARLGLKVAVYGVTGADPEGRSILTELQDEGIDTSLVALDHRHTTNASTALVFRGERTLFVWHQPRSYHLPEIPPPAWIYATSVGPRGAAVDRLHAAIRHHLDRHPTRLAFSPGTHQLRMGARALAPLLCRADLLLLNRQEACELTGVDGRPKDLLEALRRLGPKIVVMTDGIHGSYASDGKRCLRTGILSVPILDRTGAGDGYSATLMTALHLGRPLPVAMAWGTVQAANVVGVFGATPALMRRRALQAAVNRHPELVATEF
jgi:sugar/nucleoside kinase (ribokinase family)